MPRAWTDLSPTGEYAVLYDLRSGHKGTLYMREPKPDTWVYRLAQNADAWALHEAFRKASLGGGAFCLLVPTSGESDLPWMVRRTPDGKGDAWPVWVNPTTRPGVDGESFDYDRAYPLGTVTRPQELLGQGS